MLERETILVDRKIKVAVCSFEVDRLPISEGCVGLCVKIYFQSPQARNHHQFSFGQPVYVAGGMLLSSECLPLKLKSKVLVPKSPSTTTVALFLLAACLRGCLLLMKKAFVTTCQLSLWGFVLQPFSTDAV